MSFEVSSLYAVLKICPVAIAIISYSYILIVFNHRVIIFNQVAGVDLYF